MKIKLLVFVAILLGLSAPALAQPARPKYSYAAQSTYIPKQLGKVYIGMPLASFLRELKADKPLVTESRMDYLQLSLDTKRSPITKVTINAAGMSSADLEKLIETVSVRHRDTDGSEYSLDEQHLKPGADLSKLFVYAIYLEFEPTFDLKNFAVHAFGPKGVVRDPGDKYHFADIEWNLHTKDGLALLIRSLHEGTDRRLAIIGRIDGTEWALD